jgi:hypothetical protein
MNLPLGKVLISLQLCEQARTQKMHLPNNSLSLSLLFSLDVVLNLQRFSLDVIFATCQICHGFPWM